MEIDWARGNKGKNDRISLFTSDGEMEKVTIFKLALLANQIAVNELNVNKEKIEMNNNFLFKKAMESAIAMAEEGIDWAEKKNENEVKMWCNEHFLRPESIEEQLQRVIQKRLDEYGNT